MQSKVEGQKSKVWKSVSEIAEKVIADAPALFLAFPANNLVGASKVKNVPVFPIDYYVMTKDITVE